MKFISQKINKRKSINILLSATLVTTTLVFALFQKFGADTNPEGYDLPLTVQSESGIFYAHLVDKNGSPMSGVDVVLDSFLVSSDENGYVFLDGLVPDQYPINFYKDSVAYVAPALTNNNLFITGAAVSLQELMLVRQDSVYSNNEGPYHVKWEAQPLPQTAVLGQTASFKVRVKNQGNVTWEAGRYRLRTIVYSGGTDQSGKYIGGNAIDTEVRAGEATVDRVVVPGETVEINSNVNTGGSTMIKHAGTYGVQFDLVDYRNPQWFENPSEIVTLAVEAPNPYSTKLEVLSGDTETFFDGSANHGGVANYRVKVTNLGNLTWEKDRYHLRAGVNTGGTIQGDKYVGGSVVDTESRVGDTVLPQDLSPGQSVELPITVHVGGTTSIKQPGAYGVVFDMVDYVNPKWFEKYSPAQLLVVKKEADVTVTASQDRIGLGSFGRFEVNVTNNSNAAWDSSYRLRAGISQNGRVIDSEPRVGAASFGKVVQSGESDRVTIDVGVGGSTLVKNPGTYTVSFDVVKEGSRWFACGSDPVTITVSPQNFYSASLGWAPSYETRVGRFAPGATMNFSVGVANNGNMLWNAAGAGDVRIRAVIKQNGRNLDITARAGETPLPTNFRPTKANEAMQMFTVSIPTGIETSITGYGNYQIYFGLVHYGGVRWFDQVIGPFNITIEPPNPHQSRITVIDAPTTVNMDNPAGFSVKIENTSPVGTPGWNATGTYKYTLRAALYRKNADGTRTLIGTEPNVGYASLPRDLSAQTDTIVPFRVPKEVVRQPGTYSICFMMVHDWIAWFGQLTDYQDFMVMD